MPKKLILFPFGGNAREALVIIQAVNEIKKTWEVLGFLDDNASLWGREYCGVKVLGNKKLLKKFSDASVLVVPGNPSIDPGFAGKSESVVARYSIDGGTTGAHSSKGRIHPEKVR